MSRDLEEQLDELGPAYRAVVARLRAAEAEPRISRLPQVSWSSPRLFRLVSCLTAASLLAALALGIHCLRTEDAECGTPSAGFGAREYLLADRGGAAAIRELVATQNPDGSWQNAFLTRRNAEALRRCPASAAQIAYKKAMRNLRVRGLL